MTGDAAKSFRRMDVGFVVFDRLGETFDAESEMAGDAALVLGLRARIARQDASGRADSQGKQDRTGQNHIRSRIDCQKLLAEYQNLIFNPR